MTALTCGLWSAHRRRTAPCHSHPMTRPAAELPPPLRAGAFSAQELRRHGVSVERARRRDIRRLGRGIYVHAAATPTEEDVIAAYCRADSHAAACGFSAARLWRLPLPAPFDTWVPGQRVEMAGSSHRRTTESVSWRHLELSKADLVTGVRLRATSPARTLLDIAPLLAHDDLVAVGDALVRCPRLAFEGRSEPWATIPSLAEAAASFRGRGARAVREALADVRMSADSRPETFLRLASVRAGLPEPLANAEIRVDGISLGTPDLQWPELRVCGEHEGPRHRTPEQQERDIRRAELRRRHGWVEVLTTAVDLRDGCTRAVRRYREELVRRGWEP